MLCAIDIGLSVLLSVDGLSRASVEPGCRLVCLLSYFEYSIILKSIRSPRKALVMGSLLHTSAIFSGLRSFPDSNNIQSMRSERHVSTSSNEPLDPVTGHQAVRIDEQG